MAEALTNPTKLTESLLGLAAGADLLSASQPAGVTDADLCKITMTPSWNLALPEDLDEPVEVNLAIGVEQALKMTQHTLYSLASNFGVSKTLLAETPSELTQPLMNYWLSVVGADNAPRFIYNKANVALDLYRTYNAPHLSAYEMAFFVAEQLGVQAGVLPDEVTVSSYMTATFREVVFRAFLPPIDTALVTSHWQAGVQVSMSPSGVASTVLVMLFRRDDGLMVAFPRHEFKYSPKRHGSTYEAYCDWLNESIGIIVAESAEERERLHHLHDIGIEADLQNILDDLYSETALPMSLRAVVNEGIESLPEGATGYDLMACVAEAAYAQGEPEGRREKARRAAGRVYTVLGSRCSACHSLLKDHT